MELLMRLDKTLVIISYSSPVSRSRVRDTEWPSSRTEGRWRSGPLQWEGDEDRGGRKPGCDEALGSLGVGCQSREALWGPNPLAQGVQLSPWLVHSLWQSLDPVSTLVCVIQAEKDPSVSTQLWRASQLHRASRCVQVTNTLHLSCTGDRRWLIVF